MKRLLRSVIDVNGAITQENLVHNFTKLINTRIEWGRDEDTRIYGFAYQYFSAQLEMPSIQTVKDYFEGNDDLEVTERLKVVEVAESYTRTNFSYLLTQILEEQNKIKAVGLLKEAQDIITKGIEIEGERKSGIRDGLTHFMARANDLIAPDFRGHFRGDVRKDADAVAKEYLEAKNNKDKIYGRFTGIEEIDRACMGAKKGELWVHGAFPGQLKCLAGDAKVFDHKVGRRRSIEELYASGDLPIVTALDREGATNKLVLAEASHLVQNGLKEVYEVALSSGRSLGATSNHLFFTKSGWERLDALSVETWVATVENDVLTWRQVRSVQFRGVEMTYDMEIPVHHTFVANDIVTHNTTFATNWCYNLVTRYNTNVFYISFEMPYAQIRRNIYTIHAASEKWTAWGIQPPEYVGLDYRKIRDGELTPEEEKFYLETVVPDFSTNQTYQSFEVYNPEKEKTMLDIRMEAELLHKRLELGFVVIDHGQWVEPRKGKRSKDYTIEVNSVVRDAKQFALQFNNNEGIPVLLLWQINREGHSEAVKNKGEYKLNAFTYANEVEKSADVITTTFLDADHRKNSTTRFSNPKNRDNPPFEPFDAHANLRNRRMLGIDRTRQTGEGMNVEAQALFGNLDTV